MQRSSPARASYQSAEQKGSFLAQKLEEGKEEGRECLSVFSLLKESLFLRVHVYVRGGGGELCTLERESLVKQVQRKREGESRGESILSLPLSLSLSRVLFLLSGSRAPLCKWKGF